MGGFSEYDRYDAVGLAHLVATRAVRPEELLDAAVARVAATNPTINAVVQHHDDGARRHLSQGLPSGPFRGVPFLLKDLGVLMTGTRTGSGSRAWNDHVADHDTTLVERYRSAGLVIFGKTNTPELGLNVTTEPAAYGPTRNPYDRQRSAGGSSGGAAAAVAARIVPVAHATDGGGSIRIPAANCGLFGLKPTRARTPLGPDIGEGWAGRSCAHVVSRSVRDSAAFLDATQGPAPGDPYWAPPPARSYAAEVGADPGKLRIAISTVSPDGETPHPECIRAVDNTARLLSELGHRVEAAAPDYDHAAVVDNTMAIIAGNTANGLDARGRARGRPLTRDEVEPLTWAIAEMGRSFTATDYVRAVQVGHAAGRRLAAFFGRFDLALTPTMMDPPRPIGEIRTSGTDVVAWGRSLRIPFTPIYNVTGCPAASLPLHWTAEGLPVGVHLGAAFGREDLLFRISAQLEKARPWADRRPALSVTG
jgi:amidase/6-aminohexanoate-cyclic-dimer hydrolase